ncbi:MAG TPA: HAD-IIIA family hydrolase [Gemmatimonadales bacterium]
MIDPSRRAVFLDRDGTLITEGPQPTPVHGIRLIPGSAAALAEIASLGMARIVVTNQSGIGRGLFSEVDYAAAATELDRLLAVDGASLTATYYCPHLPDAGCACRKPATALYRQAIAQFDLDPAGCWYLGDNFRDIAPALELGGLGILVRTGQGPHHEAAAEAAGMAIVDDVATGLGQIARYLHAL